MFLKFFKLLKKKNNFVPIKLALVRRTFPKLFANEIVSVQPMSVPVGLAYALRFGDGSEEGGWFEYTIELKGDVNENNYINQWKNAFR